MPVVGIGIWADLVPEEVWHQDEEVGGVRKAVGHQAGAAAVPAVERNKAIEFLNKRCLYFED